MSYATCRIKCYDVVHAQQKYLTENAQIQSGKYVLTAASCMQT